MAGKLLMPAAGGAKIGRSTVKAIRFAYHGCANRPFLHMVLMEKNKPRNGFIIEQLGTYDTMRNEHGEKLCSLNLQRVCYWIGQGAEVSTPCAILLGLVGVLPIHPRTYMDAWRNRRSAKTSKGTDAV